MQQNADTKESIRAAAIAGAQQGASGLIDGGVSIDEVDPDDGDKFVSKIFGGNDSSPVASALSGTAAGGGGLMQQLLPMLAPIVLAYIGKQFAKGSSPAPAQQSARPAVAGSATCWAASWAAPSAATVAARSATSSAACCGGK